jgi:hypothetical protein
MESSLTAAPGVSFISQGAGGPLTIKTNTSSQIRYRCTLTEAASHIYIVTLGYEMSL